MERMIVRKMFWIIVGFVTLAVLNVPTEAQQNIDKRLNAMLQLGQNQVYVAAHRGDWRDAPENSIQALKYAERLGVDIVELDVKKTKDGQLVVMHDMTLDRSTTGSGLVSSYTLQQLKQLTLRAGTGHPTAYQIPTLAEELGAAEDKVILDIDQGWDYFSDVVKEVNHAATVGQVIINVRPNTSYEVFESQVGRISENLTLMAIVDMARPDAQNIIQSYRTHKRTIIQCIFADDRSAAVQKITNYGKQFPIWINSLWPDQNGNHDDERAVGQNEQDASWGWIVVYGGDIIQTDRPKELIEYLQKDKHHL